MAGNRTLKLSILADVDDLKKKLDTGSQEVEGFGGKLGEFGKKAAAAFAVAGAAAAAYAGKLLVDGVKAAIEDAAAQDKLATSLRNATGATEAQIASTEDYISKTAVAVGITDDQLRPSLQRLALATGDVTKAQNLQKIALDVAAGSGKSLESVSQALARAYEGNTAALGRLGIGISSTELKTMSFDQITQKLANTFKDQASTQAETLQGRMTRLQIAFDEAKEAVGARLLPILTELLDMFVNKVIPAGQSLIDKFKPLTKAVDDNKDEFSKLWAFLDKYILPILTGALKNAFNGIVTTLSAVVNTVGKVIDFFGDLYNTYKKLIDFLKNNPLSKFLDRINPFNNSSLSTGANVTNAGLMNENLTDEAWKQFFPNASVSAEANLRNEADIYTVNGRRIIVPPWIPDSEKQNYANRLGEVLDDKDVLKQRTEELRGQIQGRQSNTTGEGSTENITINVNSPSFIDEEGFTRSVINALNSSEARTGSLGTLNV